MKRNTRVLCVSNLSMCTIVQKITFKKLFLTNICENFIHFNHFLVLGLIEMKQDSWSNKIRVKPELSQQQPSCAFQAKSMKVTGKIKNSNFSDSVNIAVGVGPGLFCPTVSLLYIHSNTKNIFLPISCTI